MRPYSTTILAGSLAAAMAFPALAERELTLGMQDNEVSNLYAGAQAMAAMLAEVSGGELTLSIFPSSQLGDFRAMVAQVQAGELDMVTVGYPDMSYVIPELNLIGAPYALPAYRARLRVAFLNKAPMCQYRAVGHPVAMAVMEALIDDLAAATGRDPAEMRALNIRRDDSYPATSPQGLRFADLSHERCLAGLRRLMDYDALRAAQAEARRAGVLRGIGLAMMVEITNPSPMFYGVGGAPIAAQDGATLRLNPGGDIHLAASVTEQGQGTDTVLAQIAADVLAVPISRIVVSTGDTETAPHGGGTWASRGAGIGGEAGLQAGQALGAQILADG